MTSARHHSTFGSPKLPHTVVIARGETIRHFTIRPWILALSTALASAVTVGTFGSAAYLVLHDDLATAAVARQARLSQAYEDRIAALRSQLDRTVSRQLIDREKVETKVAVLLDQQVELDARYDRLEPLLDQARSSGLLPGTAPLPDPSPGAEAVSADQADSRPLGPLPLGPRPLGYAAEGNAVLDRFKLVERRGHDGARPAPTGSDPLASAISPELIREIGRAVETHETRQIEKLDALAESARSKADGIAKALASEGLPVALPTDGADAVGGEGGPFVPVPEGYRFEASCDDLEAALARLQAVTSLARKLPIARPISSKRISSTFGVRSDPFLGRSAMHTGIDFVAASGTSVKATAAGKVISAGPNGGYGQMVEVDHGGGFVTRYAHLSAILVRIGDAVPSGGVVGEVGSTGRSTGPHLHYEVRHDGEAIDPAGFLRAGSKIQSLG